MRQVTIPISGEVVRELRVGEAVSLSGVMVTGRDAAHKWIVETFIKKVRTPTEEDLQTHAALKRLLDNGVIYHCGPVVEGLDDGRYRFVAAGPTTSIREEPYQGDVMRHFNVRGVIGKGGMGARTLEACREVPGVYFHAIGGAASWIARTVSRVLEVHKLSLGVPEAMWVIEVRDFPVVVTMDAHGGSQHALVDRSSRAVLEKLLRG